MPPKPIYTKEHIIAAAVEVVRELGYEKLNARTLAKKLGSSTQPLYSLFSSMEEIKSNLLHTVESMAVRYMVDATDAESPFLSIGLGYLEFSKKEPNLFRLLFMSDRKTWDFTEDSSVFNALKLKMQSDRYLAGLGNEQLVFLLKNMFIYTHGLCTLSAVFRSAESFGESRELLHDMGGHLIAIVMMEMQDPSVLESKLKEYTS